MVRVLHNIFVWTCSLMTAGIFLANGMCDAAGKRYGYEDDAVMMREVRDSLEDMRHEVSNHEAELRMYQEKLANQDITIENLRKQMSDSYQSQKDLVKGNSVGLEAKITHLETATKGLIADLKVLKEHSNESTSVLERFQQKLSKLEKILDLQTQNMAHVDSTLHMIMEALQIKERKSEKSVLSSVATKNYVIKPGDSLGKIAVENKVSIKAIKELNPELTSDKIIVGRTIQLPQ